MMGAVDILEFQETIWKCEPCHISEKSGKQSNYGAEEKTMNKLSSAPQFHGQYTEKRKARLRTTKGFTVYCEARRYSCVNRAMRFNVLEPVRQGVRAQLDDETTLFPPFPPSARVSANRLLTTTSPSASQFTLKMATSCNPVVPYRPQRVMTCQGDLEMLINGTVHRAANSQSGTERWTAKCLLCKWLQGGGHLYRTKKSANRASCGTCESFTTYV